MVTPSDVPQETLHLDTIFSNIVHCDKVLFGGIASRQAAVDSIAMAKIVWGGEEEIRKKPVMIGCISALSPLQYSKEMSGALIEYARYGQALRIYTTPAAGSTGPITLAGLLTSVNAGILAGITLSQLIIPGVPVIYGSSCAPMDMRTGAFSVGAPEAAKLAVAVARMARFYGLPSRGVGAVTEAHLPDVQAGIEPALAFMTAAIGGINLILHSCGLLSFGMAMSYEKFIIDEELCGIIKTILDPIEINDQTIDLAVIEEVGIGGVYLTHPKTIERCGSPFFLPKLIERKN